MDECQSNNILVSCHDPGLEFPSVSQESEMLAELISWLQWSGLDDPDQQVYSPVTRQQLSD